MIADQRETAAGKLHPDLVASPGVQADMHKALLSFGLSRPIIIRVHNTSEEAQEMFDAIADYIV